MELNRDQVLALAPDASSAKAATGLLADGKWDTLGADARALWGECKGSGAKPYQVQVELGALASRCSCPSRKFPCKHGLALMLMYAQGNPRFASASAPPDWVAQWLASRQERSAKKEAAAAPADPAVALAAAAKREAARWKRIEAGAAELQRFIADQFRRGLARFDGEQAKEWSTMAARMVDAQAPGLEQQMRRALEAMERGGDGQQEAAERLGLVQILCAAVARRDALSPARLADVRTALGWPMDKDELASGPDAAAMEDVWTVVGQAVDVLDARLSERRVWLLGEGSGRYALLQDYAFKGAGWEHAWVVGHAYPARLRFHAGSAPMRAQVETRDAARPAAAPACDTVAAIESASRWLAENPWLPRVPMLLHAAPAFDGQRQATLRSGSGVLALELAGDALWTLLACSGGRHLALMGEWDGQRLRPLTAWPGGPAAPPWSFPSAGGAA